jgi:hypothetical protein
MKNRMLIVYIGISLLFGIILSGCVGRYVYDESIPEEQLCTLLIPNYYTIFKFDESEVKWGNPWTDRSSAKFPAGEHTLIMNYVGRLAYGVKVANNLKIIYDFKPGVIYKFSSTFTKDLVFYSIVEDDGSGYDY